MKSCIKCGKVVANSAQECPDCGCMAFDTEDGNKEGLGAELMMMLLRKNPVAFWIVMGVLTVAIIIFIKTFMFP